MIKRALLNKGLKLIAVMLMVIPFTASCGHREKAVEEKSARAEITVDTATVTEKKVPRGAEFPGTVTSEKTALIAPKVMALIEELTVNEGDLVEGGQLLVKLDGRDIEAKVMQAEAAVSQAEASSRRADAAVSQADASMNRAQAGIDEGNAAMIQAKANLELASKNLTRFKDLYREESIPLARLEEVQAQYSFAQSSLEQVKGKIAQAKAGKKEAMAGKAQAIAASGEAQAGKRQALTGVESAQIMLSYTSLSAPFSGVVTKKFSEAGTMASPGQPLLRIESLSYLELDVPVPEGRIKDIPLHRPINVFIDALNKKVPGVVKTYIPSGDAATHTFKVKIGLPGDKGILPGMYGRIMLADRNRAALLIPRSALVEKGKTTGVFKVAVDQSGEKAFFVPVEAGKTVQGEVEVLRGLAQGDPVVVNPPEDLKDGQALKTRKRGS
ncbi:MAG: efflux RND transporter periplasmic adaptor subunit [Candidatus Eremiobacteraeota bacterium]|nr:efflux RND transporter periplasmic adaptor subunit [Candidatus Eremiobacteraeota bacterium]